MGDQSEMETEELPITHASSEIVEAASGGNEDLDCSIIDTTTDRESVRVNEVEDTISAAIITSNVDIADDTQDQNIVHQEDVTLQIRRAVQNLLNDDNLSWSMKTWREKVVSDIKLKALDDNTKAIIKQIVHEELEVSMKNNQTSQAENAENTPGDGDFGDDDNTQLQSEVHDQNFEDSSTQPQVIYTNSFLELYTNLYYTERNVTISISIVRN